MSRRSIVPIVVVCAVSVVVIAALQGPVVFGPPRFDLVISQLGGEPTPPTEQAAPSRMPQNGETAPTGFLNPTTIVIALGSLVVAALVAAGFLIVRALRRRRRAPLTPVAVSTLPSEPTDSPHPDSTTAAPALARGIERSLTILDAHADPNDAVIEAWLGLQQSAEDSGFSLRASETPAEFTVRVLARDQSIDTDLAALLTLYQDVRFGAHQASSSDIDRARSALRSIQEVWT